MKKVLPLVCLPLLCLVWLAGCDESVPTAPEGTVTGLQAASGGPSGEPGWVRAYAAIGWNPDDGWQVLYGLRVDRVVEVGEPGSGETCVVLDPKLGLSAQEPIVVVVTSAPWTAAGADVWDAASAGIEADCIHVWTGMVDNPTVAAQGYSIVVY